MCEWLFIKKKKKNSYVIGSLNACFVCVSVCLCVFVCVCVCVCECLPQWDCCTGSPLHLCVCMICIVLDLMIFFLTKKKKSSELQFFPFIPMGAHFWPKYGIKEFFFFTHLTFLNRVNFFCVCSGGKLRKSSQVSYRSD